MYLRKPTWLRNILNHLNWDILWFKVHIGDAIETSIDWVIDWLNITYGKAEEANHTATQARYLSVELTKQAREEFSASIKEARNNIVRLEEDMRELAAQSAEERRALAKHFGVALANLDAEIARRAEEARLWAAGLAQELADREQAAEAMMTRLREVEKEQLSLWDMIKLFFTDPAAFIYHLFDEIIERFW